MLSNTQPNYRLLTNKQLMWAIVVLAIPAHLWNLGLLPLFADEPTRAVVAQEMIIRNEYIVPTINGNFYYNKPPLYNWLLVGVNRLSGPFTEFTLRLPAVASLALLAWLAFAWVRRKLGDVQVAFFASMGFVLMARMLIFDSLLGHIDLTFSVVIFLQFMATFYFYQRQKWLALFVSTYLLAAIAFLLKGLPPVVFQGCTLLALFGLDRKWKPLFSWQHFLGGLLFLGLVSSYYYTYSLYNSLDMVFERLWTQSSERTVLERSTTESIVHLIKFPFEQLFVHCIPFGLFALFALNRPLWREIWAHPFLRFVSIVLFANLPAYWLSPTTAPRYIFMLYPLAFILIGYAYYRNRERMPRLSKGVEWLLGGVLVMLPIGVWAVFWVPELEVLPYLTWATPLISLGFAGVAVGYWRRPAQRVLWLMLALIGVRFAFDAYVLPHRYVTSKLPYYRESATRIAVETGTEPVYCFGYTPVNHEISYYFALAKGQVLQRVDTLVPNRLYLLNEEYASWYNVERLDSFHVAHENSKLILVRTR